MHNFKMFIKKILYFLLILLIVMVYLVLIGIKYCNYNNYFIEEIKKDEGQITTMVCGASRGSQGIDPYIIDNNLNTNSFNVSSSGASLSARLSICEQYADNNPVETIILEISEDSLVLTTEEYGYQGLSYALKKLDKAHQIDLLCNKLTLKDKLFFVQSYLRNDLQENVKMGKSVILSKLFGTKNYLYDNSPDNYMGKGFYIEYYPTYDNSYFSSLEFQQNEIGNINKSNINILNEFVEYCDKKDINLFLVSLPSATLYLNQYTDLDTVYDFLETYTSNDCYYINYNLLKNKEEFFPDETAYYDATHLSTDSSTVLTNSLTDMIKKIRNNEDISNLFYSSYKEKLEQTMN